MQVDDSLCPWPSIRENFRNQRYLGLLLGNGASRAIWGRFAYSSLYQIACDPARKHPLTPVDQAFFEEMGTQNFEVVLSALATTKMVCGHLRKEFGDVEARYQSIRRSLIDSVNTIHVAPEEVPDKVRKLLGEMIQKYDYVYTTNYDLLLYWAMMATEPKPKDFLWGRDQSFDSTDADEWNDSSTKVFFLHGALHLYHDLLGNTRKKIHDVDAGDLLHQFDTAGDWLPLFISEGSSSEKLRSIRRNDYLSFAYWKFIHHRGPLIVFGHSLNDEFDGHLLKAMSGWRAYDRRRFRTGNSEVPPRDVAISVMPELTSTEIIEFKNRLVNSLGGCQVQFFDATTHPFHPAANPDLALVENADA